MFEHNEGAEEEKELNRRKKLRKENEARDR